jgi:hypothetical protein
MKKLTITLLAAFFAFNSCNKLELLPLDKLTAATFYKTKADFDGAIFAAYSSIQDLWGTSTETLGERGEYWKTTVVVTDDVIADVAAGTDEISRDIDNLVIRASDRPFAAAYTQIYEGILRANLVLENLDGQHQLTETEKNRTGGRSEIPAGFASL